jgi:glycosyltransferase involved in cell wall biosynthesis
MNPAAVDVMHLLNGFWDSSISRIIRLQMYYLGPQKYHWHIGVLSGSGELREEYQHLGAQVIDFSNDRNHTGNVVRNVRQYARKHHIRIIHTHTPRAALVAAASFSPKMIHLATKHLLYSPGYRRWGMVYMLLDRFSLYLPNHLVAVSKTMQRQMLALPGVRSRRVTMIRNGVKCEAYYAPDERAQCRQQLGLTSDNQTIGYTGRLMKGKCIDVLLEAFSRVLARHPNARLLIVGDGESRSQLEALATRLNTAHAVIWTGFRTDIPRLLAAMDIYVQSSNDEGLSLSLLEAMAAGKAVVATNVGGTSEAVIDGVTGVLVSTGSPEAIATAINDLLDAPEKWRSLAQAGRDYIIREFDVQQMMNSYDRLYEALISNIHGDKHA